ncbi:glutathione ABC transporter substrate-binding protein [Texcoconibacillus texcoconensis]|uniref:Peptide/nickel transport system substrate-binding protein n=1 Tax=Texcoconibacillus texcoconensis TaxID=1095777 RepID=A0A840QLQ6_9BACI|nr:glutathione ABC transporter substrate-binding protein [Texcoconibacillus texcoconensis]MBB5172298.1 peptide/nickel transport system substrate-binding protein [Texcoconibacillus texcoconensis]
MFKSKYLKAGVFSTAFALTLAGCASEPDSEEASTDIDDTDAGEEAAGDDVSAGDNDLVIGVSSDATSMDPHTSSDVPSGNAQTNIYDTLVKYDTNMELEPLLAKEWEPVEDDVWEFKLREDVYFHDGTEFNAEVVEANIERILSEETASPRAILVEIIEDIEIVDDHTIQFITEDPFAPLPAHMAHYAISIISQDVIDEDNARVEEGGQPGDYVNENPVGTGFFKFDYWDHGDKVVLKNNEDYWGENAKVDSVTLQVIPEDLTRVGELETGGAHIIDPVDTSDMTRVESADGANVYERNAASITYLGYNMEKEPFDDARVRRAISKTLNKEAMLEGILDGTGATAFGPVDETNFGYSEDVNQLDRDPEKAKELLAEAGYEDGFETTIWTNDTRERMDIAELTQAGLAEIGVDAEIEVLEWGAYLDATSAGEHDMFILGLSLGTGDADYPMHMLFHSDSVGEGNRVMMDDPEFDEMLYQARIQQDEDARLALYEDATEYLIEEAPMSFLYHPSHVMGYRDEIEGFWSDASGLYQLQDVEIN